MRIEHSALLITISYANRQPLEAQDDSPVAF